MVIMYAYLPFVVGLLRRYHSLKTTIRQQIAQHTPIAERRTANFAHCLLNFDFLIALFVSTARFVLK